MSLARRRLVAWAALPVGAAVVGALGLLAPITVPIVLVLALASLVRVGETVLDRVMVTLALGTGLLCVAGLGFSLWPWGLDPLPVAQTAWAGIWALALLTGRRPAVPRWSSADLAIPVAGVFALLPAWRILHADGFEGRLALVMIGEDNARHMMWWAGIRDSGTYLFMAGDRFPGSVIKGTEFYPQAWHFVAAVLDRFAGEGGGLAEVDHYIAWTLLTHAYLLLNVVWLTMVTRRRFGALQAVGAAVVAGSLVTGGELFRPVVSGYPAESLGLSLALSAAAVAALSSTRARGATCREAMLVLAATVVATSFAYYVFLVPIGLFVAVWLWRRRHDVRRTPVVLALTTVATAGLAAVMPLIGVTSAVEAGALEVAGNAGPIWISLVVLGGIAAAGMILTGAWREPAIRWVLVASGCFLGFGGALALAFQSGYYVHKIWHVPIATAAVLCAALVLRIPRAPGRDGLVRTATALTGLAAAAVVGAGLTPWGPGLFTDDKVGTSSFGVWRNDFFAQPETAASVLRVLRTPAPAAGTTSFVVDLNPYAGYGIDLFSSTLDGTSDEMRDIHYVSTFTQPDRLEEQLEQAPGRVRLLATSLDAAVFAKGVVEEQGLTKRVRIVILRGAED